jgi:DNA-binding response OmpR family regulator
MNDRRARYEVLVVDDDDATRAGLTALLANAGFVVDAASNGEAAVEKLDRYHIGVALVDVRLPGIDGLGILEHCVARQRPAKVIVMTGIDTTDAALNALRGQAYDFLPKPIEPMRLVDTVRRALATTPETAPIEVLSAKPEWVELIVPCTREAAERIQSFVQQLEADLPEDVRESVGLAFRELLMNGVEWAASSIRGSASACRTSARAGCCSTESRIRDRASRSTGFRTPQSRTRKTRWSMRWFARKRASVQEDSAWS